MKALTYAKEMNENPTKIDGNKTVAVTSKRKLKNAKHQQPDENQTMSRKAKLA